jgi:hypothetical protein
LCIACGHAPSTTIELAGAPGCGHKWRMSTRVAVLGFLFAALVACGGATEGESAAAESACVREHRLVCPPETVACGWTPDFGGEFGELWCCAGAC